MANNRLISIVCHSQLGSTQSINNDHISLFEYSDGLLISLMDIATKSSLESYSFAQLFNRTMSETITDNSFESAARLLEDINIVINTVRQTFKTGSASLLVAYIPKHKRIIWGFTAGDVRLGKVQGNHVTWITNVHTGANPLGESFTDEMRAAPHRHLLTRCLNMRKPFRPDHFEIEFTDPAFVLVASDGFWSELSLEKQRMLLSGQFIATSDDCSFVYMRLPLDNIKGDVSGRTRNIQHFYK